MVNTKVRFVQYKYFYFSNIKDMQNIFVTVRVVCLLYNFASRWCYLFWAIPAVSVFITTKGCLGIRPSHPSWQGGTWQRVYIQHQNFKHRGSSGGVLNQTCFLLSMQTVKDGDNYNLTVKTVKQFGYPLVF